MIPARPPTVTILTYCAHPFLAYGTLLVFKSVRVGFPAARIEVFDNGSHPEVKERIRAAAAGIGAGYHDLAPRHYTEHYCWLLAEQTEFDSLVIVDPDVVFWSEVEHWQFADALMAGRLMPSRSTDLGMCLPRLHPSLLWVPDVARLRAQMAKSTQAIYAHDGFFTQRSNHIGGRAVFWDTLAGLYQAFPDQCHAFTESELDCYDHLFYGSHLPLTATVCGVGFDSIVDGHQAAATGNLEALRGIWRKQQAYFEQYQLLREECASDAIAAALTGSCRLVQRWQAMTYSDGELLGAMVTVGKRIAELA
jgi:hypothetical protein